jgi:CheY-like chemotaxis protein
VVEIAGSADAAPAMASGLDLLVAIVKDPADELLEVVRMAKQHEPPIPVITLTAGSFAREAAVAAGSDDLLDYPPQMHEIQQAVIRLIGRPTSIR